MNCGNCKKCDTATDEYCDRTDCKDCCPNMQQKPKTNADRIRAMSDEELAKFFGRYGFCGGIIPHSYCSKQAVCSLNCVVNWLKQPVEEE